MRIDKTARQNGTPNWLKELIYVDDAKNAAKPAREGGTRSDSLLKANATHPTTCDGGPKEIATYPSNSEGNVLNEPAETGEENFDTCNGELEIAAESECDLAFFSLRKITEKARSAVAKTLDQLFLGLMDRSMGETNFFVVTMMGLACAKVISAQFFEAEAFGELNLLAFLIAICTAAVFTASKKLPTNPLAALCISVLPAFIETVAICAVRGLNLSEEYALITGFALVCAVGGLFLGGAWYLVDDTDPNEALKRAIVGAIWGFAIGTTAVIIAETTPIITDALANRDIPTFLEQLLAAH
ncbi:MAG: hypothetical protein U0J41_06210 [Slackia isoflavoniconvertens]|uniref:hypothetical protein n=1 Tax=Slackia isoflavoniconvertens TaxID=572010 RepID=UPI002EC78584|nr:hypothetical protein [Slackia isoflavoniconvertens]